MFLLFIVVLLHHGGLGEINVQVDVIFIFDVHFSVFNHSVVSNSSHPHGPLVHQAPLSMGFFSAKYK